MKIFPDDKIRIIFSAMGLEKKTFEFSDEFFQTLIYEYHIQYPDLFSEFSFQSNGTIPYSELLERIITRAKISRSLKTVNPDFAMVQLNVPPLENLRSKYRELLKDTDFEILTTIGKDARDRVKITSY
jgi:hypothetical protein